jgi:hypothetical protein
MASENVIHLHPTCEEGCWCNTGKKNIVTRKKKHKKKKTNLSFFNHKFFWLPMVVNKSNAICHDPNLGLVS